MGDRATMDDFRTIAALIGIEQHWMSDDGKDTLSYERAKYWRQIVFLAHIPQLVLKARLDRGEPSDRAAFTKECNAAMNARALLVLALDDAVQRKVPIVWPDLVD